MISFEDCFALCGLTRDEVLALAEHEHIPEIAAAALGQYLLNSTDRSYDHTGDDCPKHPFRTQARRHAPCRGARSYSPAFRHFASRGARALIRRGSPSLASTEPSAAPITTCAAHRLCRHL